MGVVYLTSRLGDIFQLHPPMLGLYAPPAISRTEKPTHNARARRHRHTAPLLESSGFRKRYITALQDTNIYLSVQLGSITAKMAPSNLPPIFNATSQDIEMLLAAQSHLGSKNLQVHMEPYLWKTRPDGINVINIGKTW